MKIVLATCNEWPKPKSDAPLRAELRNRGHLVESAPWNGSLANFLGADLVILRACWDYYSAPKAFQQWLAALEDHSVSIANPLNMVHWNFDKRYLLELMELGIDVIPTAIVDAQLVSDTRKLMANFGWKDVVRKPLHGQSGYFMDRLDSENEDWPEAQFEGPALLQPFQADINELGETLLVFFSGKFSHAIKRNLAAKEWRSNSQFGSTRSLETLAPELIIQVEGILGSICEAKGWSEPPLYARIDGLVRGNQFNLMEFELIEPALGFDLEPQAAAQFADCIERYKL